ncbi:hypothetical protein [Pseudomonas quasicaspiana]|uniref:hypothetical protein n=1 Tax=Pseudomonas quasicaspiana TaxID=2829821 RepID=UPI001E3A77DC|nr:hypothetical protein [Pseudomonas quasicaspiana]MCD5980538.1 hypothetical protein [Pseudomonas quasicaspiana]
MVAIVKKPAGTGKGAPPKRGEPSPVLGNATEKADPHKRVSLNFKPENRFKEALDDFAHQHKTSSTRIMITAVLEFMERHGTDVSELKDLIEPRAK